MNTNHEEHHRGRRRGRPEDAPAQGGRMGPRGRGGWRVSELPSAADAPAWFAGRLPDDWYADVDVTVDREEITVIGALADEVDGSPESADAAADGRISRFRSDTKAKRIEIAQEAEARFGRTVSWGARLGETTALFTHQSVPVMTRLKQPERVVLDTLVDAGVARSRSDALAWSVRLVAQHADEWLASLREAMADVDKLREAGPAV